MFDIRQRLYDIGNMLKGVGVEHRVAVPLTRNTTYTPATSTANCYYDPSEKRVYFRCMIDGRSSIDFPENKSANIYTVPEEYAPPAVHPLSVHCGSSTPLGAYIGTAGDIYVIAHGNIVSNTWHVHVCGYWDLELSGGGIADLIYLLSRKGGVCHV